MTSDDEWFEEWVSRPRFATYLKAAGGDRFRGRDLYDWNATLSAAFLHDFAHLEVGLRNAYNTVLQGAVIPGEHHWTQPGSLLRLFPLQLRRDARTGNRRDTNAITRRKVEEAVAKVRPASGALPLPGKVVAELTFGFWTYLTSDRLEKQVWVPYLHTAYPAGTNRHDIRDALEELRSFRNRVAHHENILTGSESRRRRLIDQVRRLSAPAATDLQSRSDIATLLQLRP